MAGDSERITRLETKMDQVVKDIDELKEDAKQILNALAQMSGGRKALFGMAALIGSAISVIATLVGMHLFGK